MDIIFWGGIWPFITTSKPNYDSYTRQIAPYQLAHWLRKHRFKCQVIDYTQYMTVEELVSFTEAFITSKTIAIAISAVFWPKDHPPSNQMEAIRILKLKYPKLKVVAGSRGHREHPLLDRWFHGESEDSLLTWCQEEKYGTSMPNIRFDIVTNDHVYHRDDIIMDHETLLMELGRGCIFKCKFCAYPNNGKKKNTFQRDYSYIENEIRYNYDHYGTTTYAILDDTANDDIDRIRFLADLNHRLPFQLNWGGYIRADLVYKNKNHNMLLDAGLRTAYFGFESFHPKASQVIGKGWNGKHGMDYFPKLYHSLFQEKVSFQGTFIAGLPYDTYESIHQTKEWMKEHSYMGHLLYGPLNLQPDSSQFPLSEFESNSEKYHYHKEPYPVIWTNDEYEIKSYQEAKAISDEVNDYLKEGQTYGGPFKSAGIYNLGYEHQDIMKMNISNSIDEVELKRKEFIIKYKKELTNHINRM